MVNTLQITPCYRNESYYNSNPIFQYSTIIRIFCLDITGTSFFYQDGFNLISSAASNL